jgi:hypothetical protein
MKTELEKMAPIGTGDHQRIDAEHRVDRCQQRVRHRLRHVDHGERERGDQIGREMAAIRRQAAGRRPKPFHARHLGHRSRYLPQITGYRLRIHRRPTGARFA